MSSVKLKSTRGVSIWILAVKFGFSHLQQPPFQNSEYCYGMLNSGF
ncbi:hypothetical protein BVRB_1g014820 [Beta vulgaris subsp. vulgaris]|nr:hypothetical protein BVRB_1g014820 [Beta vulgaris subsp. vulgaris]